MSFSLINYIIIVADGKQGNWHCSKLHPYCVNIEKIRYVTPLGVEHVVYLARDYSRISLAAQ